MTFVVRHFTLNESRKVNVYELLILFQIKHYIADYPLQSEYMLKKAQKRNWALPLTLHSIVHGMLTLVIIMYVNPSMWYLSIVDAALHFIMDRVKGDPSIMNRYKVSEKPYWLCLGLDQMFHHVTGIAITYILLK